MVPRMPRARLRARRSRQRFSHRLTRSIPAWIGLLLVVGLLFGASFAAFRVYGFVHELTGKSANPIQLIQHEVDPPAGSVAWKLKHGERVNILLLGYGGSENDAPWLTDSMLVVSIDPANKRALMASIPRDLWVDMSDAFANGRKFQEKINAAFEIGVDDATWPGKKPEYTGRDGGGRYAEHVVSRVTGIGFDRYVGMDFKAFRDIVDALGGITVHMDGPLDDCHYPNYHDGYVNRGVPVGWPCPAGAGIHFPAGDYQVSGEQALQLARSREASQAEQATDFGRSRRQQMIMSGIKKKAVSVNGVAKAPQLMAALEKNFKTDLDLNDMKALYSWGSNLPDSAIFRVALTHDNFLAGFWGQRGTCGPYNAYVLCPLDPSYTMIKTFFSGALMDPRTQAEKAPIQIANGWSDPDAIGRATDSLRQLEFQVGDPVGARYTPTSVIYDYSGGQYPLTAAWMTRYFGANVVAVTPATQPPSPGQRAEGLVVVTGRDFVMRWYGKSP
jgi:LCP family protein required for cell wall assembly